jgi:LemA protein
MKAMGCLIGVVVVALVLGLIVMQTYNSMVGLNQGVEAAWAEVQSQYQRRADLIPNLVATVQGAANFERSTLEAVVKARAEATRPAAPNLPSDPRAFAEWQAAQDRLSGALSRLLVVAEQYPDLKATQNFRELQAQIEGTENRIAVARMRFNDAAKEYNTRRLRFPATLVAGMFGFTEKAYFQAQPGADQAPQVQFQFPPAGSPAASPVPPTTAPASPRP